MLWKVVDLPAPFCPIRPNIWPSLASNETLFKAWTLENDFETLSIFKIRSSPHY